MDFRAALAVTVSRRSWPTCKPTRLRRAVAPAWRPTGPPPWTVTLALTSDAYGVRAGSPQAGPARACRRPGQPDRPTSGAQPAVAYANSSVRGPRPFLGDGPIYQQTRLKHAQCGPNGASVGVDLDTQIEPGRLPFISNLSGHN